MIITLGGRPGSGKSTVAKILAKKLNLKHYSNGDFMRELAEKRNLSLLELSKIAEKDKKIDEELDKRQIELGKKEDNFVIDSRLGFHFIPKAKKVFLDASLETRARRVLGDKSRKENNPSLKKAKQNLKTREKSETERYSKYYGLNPYDPKNHHFVLDTSNSNPKEIADKIIEFINKN